NGYLIFKFYTITELKISIKKGEKKMRNTKGLWKLLVVAVLAVVLAACQGEAAEKDSETTKKGGDAKELEGRVVIDGSGTVYPLMAKLAEEYMINEQENVSVEVSRAGT